MLSSFRARVRLTDCVSLVKNYVTSEQATCFRFDAAELPRADGLAVLALVWKVVDFIVAGSESSVLVQLHSGHRFCWTAAYRLATCPKTFRVRAQIISVLSFSAPYRIKVGGDI